MSLPLPTLFNHFGVIFSKLAIYTTLQVLLMFGNIAALLAVVSHSLWNKTQKTD